MTDVAGKALAAGGTTRYPSQSGVIDHLYTFIGFAEHEYKVS